MKCQILFSGKNKKNISKCRLLKILPRVLSVKSIHFNVFCTLGKITADDILKYFSLFSQQTGIDISCKLSPSEAICMKCLILFLGKIKTISITLSSAELAQRVVKFKH